MDIMQSKYALNGVFNPKCPKIAENAKKAWMPRKEIFGHVGHVRCLLTRLNLRIEIEDST